MDWKLVTLPNGQIRIGEIRNIIINYEHFILRDKTNKEK